MRLSHTLLCSIVLYILLILLSLTAGLLSHSMQQILHPFISMSRVKQKVFHHSSSLLKEMERQLALVFPLFY